MRIVALAEGDPASVRTWSGIPTFASSALEAVGHEVIPFHSKSVRFVTRVADRVGKLATGGTSFDLFRNRERRQVLGRVLDKYRPDLIISFANKADAHVLPPRYPLVYVGDATLPSLISYYDYLDGFPQAVLARCLFEERSTLTRANRIVMSSEWAARSAIHDAGVSAAKVVVAPFGACLPKITRSQVGVPDGMAFLWCGVDWERKGGDIAVEAVAIMRQRGFAATLRVVGCEPPARARRDFVEVVGFLDKSNACELDRLVEVYRSSLALLLPSRAEAFGMVFSEAAAFGRPSIAYQTGGVESAVINGETGLLVDPSCSADAFADAGSRLIVDIEHREGMARAARTRYEMVLNWDAWAATLIGGS